MAEQAHEQELEQVEELEVPSGEELLQEQPEEEQSPIESTEYSEAEQKAMEMGWNPDPASLEGTDKQWIPAEEFLRNQTFFTEIKKLKRDLKKQEKVTQAFREQNKIAAQRAYQQAIDDLKQQKLVAAEDRDLGTMLKIDEAIEDLKDKQNQELVKHEQAYTKEVWDEHFEIFQEDNPWYGQDKELTSFADQIGWEYAQKNPRSSPEEVYNQVRLAVQQRRSKPTTTQKKTAPAVISPRAGTSTKPKHTMRDVPAEHRAIAMTLIKAGEMSEADYLKQYFYEENT